MLLPFTFSLFQKQLFLSLQDLLSLHLHHLISIGIEAKGNQHTIPHTLTRNPRGIGGLFYGYTAESNHRYTIIAHIGNNIKCSEATLPKPTEEENANNSKLRQGRIIGITDKTTTFIQSPNSIQIIFIIQWRIVFPSTITSKSSHA